MTLGAVEASTMEIVTCPMCRTRVAPSDDGRCPACRHPISGTAPRPDCDTGPAPDDSSSDVRSPAQEEPHGPTPQAVEPLLDFTGRLLKHAPLPRQCSVCDARQSVVCCVKAEHEDFSVALPIWVCRRCMRKPPFAKGRDLRPIIYCLGLALALLCMLAGQIFLGLVCIAGGALAALLLRPQKSLSEEERSARLRALLESVSTYRMLLESYPDISFSPPAAPLAANVEDAAIATRYAESVQLRRAIYCLSSAEELSRSSLPPVVGPALAELIDRVTIDFLRGADDLQGRFVQVACAILPHRRNAFEIQGLPYPVAAELEARLSSLPSWPVTYPVALLVQRRLRGELRHESWDVDVPFATWRRRLGPSQELSPAEIALRFHRVDLPERAVEIRLEDIEAIRAWLPENVDLTILKAEYLKAEAKFDESLAIYDSLIEQYPDETYVRQMRAYCLEAAGRLEHAAAECQAILSESPDDAMSLGYLAHLQLGMSRPEDALETATKALALKSHSQLYLVRAQARVTLGQFDRAMTDLNRAVAKDANTADAYLLRARLYLHKERYDRALADIQQYERTAGRSFESVYLRATALRGKGETDEAIKVLEATPKEAEEYPILRVYRADFLAETGKLELALADCDAVIGQFPDFAPAYSTRAAIHLESDRVQAALEDAERAVELDLTNSRTLMIRGLAQAALGSVEQAEADLSQAIELDEENTLAFYNRARLRVAQQDFPAAIEDLSAAIKLHPDWSEALVQRGFLQLALEEPDDALDDFEAAMRVAPSMADAYRGRAHVHQRKGRQAEALADLDKALLLDPDNVACRMARTTLLMNESDTDAAKADLDAALQLDPDLVPALFQRGQLHLSLGEHEAAFRDFDAIIEQDPDAAFAFIGRSVAREQAGDLEQSARDADEATQSAPLEAEELELARLLMNASAAHANEQFERAVKYATEAIELAPDRPEAHRIRAAAYWYSEQFVEALDDYSHLLEDVDEPQTDCYNGRGQVYAEMGEFESALSDLDRAVALAREEGSAARLAYCLNGRGRALTGLGRYAEAERAFEESLRLRSDNAWLHYNRGLLYVERGEPHQAVACFELSLQVSKPKLTPRKTARAKGFIGKMSKSRPPDTTDQG